jgi:hypothetical protein
VADQLLEDRAKENQGESKENTPKSKEKSLDLLGFIRQNWDISMGYGESKEKNLPLPPDAPSLRSLAEASAEEIKP